jgi:hypothetical protein
MGQWEVIVCVGAEKDGTVLGSVSYSSGSDCFGSLRGLDGSLLEIPAPLVLLILGLWMIVTSYLQKRQAPPQSTTNNEGLENRNEE